MSQKMVKQTGKMYKKNAILWAAPPEWQQNITLGSNAMVSKRALML